MAEGERKISETIEYLTQIHIAWDGTEQRMAVREHPRRNISYRYTGTRTDKSEQLRAMAFSQQTQQIQFPLWHAATRLKYKIYKDESRIDLTPTNVWDYRNCCATLLYLGDDYANERLYLQEVLSTGRLRLKEQINGDWEAYSTGVVPVFWGVLQQEDSYSDVTASIADLNINVTMMPAVTDVEIPVSCDEFNYPRLTIEEAKNAPATLEGLELWMLPPSWNDDVSTSYSRNANLLDNETGMFRYDLKSKNTTTRKTMEYVAKSREEIHFLTRFFYRCKGRWRAFFAPTWSSDVALAETCYAGSTYILATMDSYYKYYKAQKRRKKLIAFYIDNTIQIINIVGFSLDNDGHGKIFLEKPLERTLDKEQVRLISFLCKWRHDSDTLSIDYETTEIANISFNFVEVTD